MPSNRVLVIYGKTSGGNAAKCVHGGAAFVVPLIQDYDYLSLDPIQIEVPLKGALSIENIRVNVPSVFTVAIGTDPETMQNAAIRLLGLDTEEIKQQAGDIIFGQLRQVIASMRIEDINRDRDKFLESIQKSLEPELKKIGLVLINVNITDITDESGYIEAIGRKAAAEAIQQAKIDVAEQEKRARSASPRPSASGPSRWPTRPSCARSAPARRPASRPSRVAQLDKDRQVGEQTAPARTGSADQGIATATSDPHRRARPRPEGRRAAGQVRARSRGSPRPTATSASAWPTPTPRRSAAKSIAQANVADAQADAGGAQGRGLSARRDAEARSRGRGARGAEPCHGQGRARRGRDASRPRNAPLSKRPAKAEKAKMIVEAEAAAEKAKLEAEAPGRDDLRQARSRGPRPVRDPGQEGRGLEEDHRRVRSAQAAFQLLMLEHIDALAQASAQAISNIKFDKVVVWEGGGDATARRAPRRSCRDMARMMPPMLQVMKDIGGVEMPEYFARMTGDTPADRKPVAAEPKTNGAPAANPASASPVTPVNVSTSPPATADKPARKPENRGKDGKE